MQAHIDTMLRDQRTEVIAGLRAGTNEMLTNAWQTSLKRIADGPLNTKVFTYEGLIARAETEIEWGKGGKLIDALWGPALQDS